MIDFVYKYLDIIFKLLFNVNFTDLTTEQLQFYVLTLVSIYIGIKLIQLIIALFIKFVKGVVN